LQNLSSVLLALPQTYRDSSKTSVEKTKGQLASIT